MSQFIEYARHMNADEHTLQWVERVITKHLQKNEERTEEIEHIIDFLVSPSAPKRISRMSFKEAKASAEKWIKAQAKKGDGTIEAKKDTQVVLDFKDGFKFVKLVGENAYKREGFLMRHCVAGYFGKSVEIFSLRDADNMPHCTVEKDVQIKGKGNGDISPKYIDYVVRFLEHTGMKVRDSEMAHLVYEPVKFGAYAKQKLYRDRYAVKGTKIEYRDDVVILPTLKSVTDYSGEKIVLLDGDLRAIEKTKLNLPQLTEVSGSVYVQQGATFTAPVLTEVSCSVYVQQGGKLNAPKLKKK